MSKTTDLCCNPYSLLPTEIVVQLVGSLNNLRQTVFHQILNRSKDDVRLYMVWRIRDGYGDYMIVEIPFAGPFPYNPITADDFRFYSVNYDDDGTLIQSLIMDNRAAIVINVIRTFVTCNFRSSFYTLNFNLYQFGDPSAQKELLCNLFAFPKFSFVLFGNIVMNFTLIDYFPTISYIGRLNFKEGIVDSYFNYDSANGTLLGSIQSQLVFLWNTRSFTLTNYYPELSGTTNTLEPPTRRPVNVVIGGQQVYSVEERLRDPQNPADWDIIRRATKARLNSYFGNEPSGGKLEFTSLKEFILIKDTTQPPYEQPYYIIAFTTVKEGLNQFPVYAVIGSSDFLDTQSKFRTFPIVVRFVDKKDDSFQQYETIFFKFTPREIRIYRPGFESWRVLNKASVAVNDLNMTLLRSQTTWNVFDSVQNRDSVLPFSQEKPSNTFTKRFGGVSDF